MELGVKSFPSTDFSWMLSKAWAGEFLFFASCVMAFLGCDLCRFHISVRTTVFILYRDYSREKKYIMRNMTNLHTFDTFSIGGE